MSPLRETFDEVAELYDRVRPRYPDALVAALIERAGLDDAARVLEVGPGTGQLTLPLARLGCRITAVELGPSLAAVARRNLAAFPRVRVETGDFERWPLPPEPFDAAVSATAWHWLDPLTRVARAADALRPGGTLALITTAHVAGGDLEFFARVQRCYEHWDPATQPGLRPPEAATVATDTAELRRSGRFRDLQVERRTQDITYTTARYLDVLRTYSGHRALDPATRAGLLDCIGELIDSRFGGRVTKRYLHELITARAPA